QFKLAKEETKSINEIRPVIVHAQLLDKDQLDKVKELNMIPSFFVAHVYHWGDIHIKNFGMERASRISLAKSAQDKGIMYTFHQDSPVIEPNMLETIWCA
ncbi:amidohydrolase, partial [Clostridium saudiense]|nr:amidohydrolase [Clostridium saudiense]